MATGNRGTTFNYIQFGYNNASASQVKSGIYTCPSQVRAKLVFVYAETSSGTMVFDIRRTGTNVSGTHESTILTLAANTQWEGYEDETGVQNLSGGPGTTLTQHWMTEGDVLLFTNNSSGSVWLKVFIKEERQA